MADEINPTTGQCWYAGSVQSVKTIVAVLNLDGGRLQKITPEKIYFYMDMAEQTIDGYLSEYYFTPIRPYNQTMPDGVTKLVFPGRLRRIAQYLAAGLMLQSEFQALEPNINESVQGYIEDSKKELLQLTMFNQRIPGQCFKSAVSRTMPHSMQPAMTPTESTL